ncbi:PilN domain-containing protein [Cellulomonas hominis]|uniref:PilN domain-containing protein n=1 Tax=Cellulomonas hominis TaxID=156981 RepID=UPI00144400D8|nr:hypothetical protein [Cellulomonas hominis]NKY10385.1 hypothetical protein [Cellulomonas hominis]
MTATEERQRTQSRVVAPTPMMLLSPRVNLLPPEVREARELRRTRRWLAIGLLGVVGACGLAWGGGMVVQAQAQDDLTMAQAETGRIAAETQQYAELQTTQAELDRAADLRRAAMTSDVEWSQYLWALSLTAPEGVRFESVALEAISAVGTEDQVAAPTTTDESGFGTMTVVARSATLPDTATWLDQLQFVPGVVDAWVGSAVYSGADGTVFYRIQLTATLTDDAMSGRFDTETED